MDANPALLNTYDATIGRATQIASVFRGYGEIFPSSADIALTNAGKRSLLVAWYLDTDRFTGYTSGAHDQYLDQEAAAARSYGATIYIRPWAEMNGDWQDFQPTASGSAQFGGTPAQFTAAWRHVVNRFRLDGATNVRWVFNPTADTYTQTTNVRTIWPGAAYVNVLGLDGYNWGNSGVLTWRSFTNIFTTQYNRLTALDEVVPLRRVRPLTGCRRLRPEGSLVRVREECVQIGVVRSSRSRVPSECHVRPLGVSADPRRECATDRAGAPPAPDCQASPPTGSSGRNPILRSGALAVSHTRRLRLGNAVRPIAGRAVSPGGVHRHHRPPGRGGSVPN